MFKFLKRAKTVQSQPPSYYTPPKEKRRGDFERNDKNRWECLSCYDDFVEHPGLCPNCTSMNPPKYAEKWDLKTFIKLSEKYFNSGDKFGEVRSETYIGIVPDENGDTFSLVIGEASYSSFRSEKYMGINRETCSGLSLLLWQAAQGSNLNLYLD